MRVRFLYECGNDRVRILFDRFKYYKRQQLLIEVKCHELHITMYKKKKYNMST